jgi:hypothetical protein
MFFFKNTIISYSNNTKLLVYTVNVFKKNLPLLFTQIKSMSSKAELFKILMDGLTELERKLLKINAAEVGAKPLRDEINKKLKESSDLSDQIFDLNSALSVDLSKRIVSLNEVTDPLEDNQIRFITKVPTTELSKWVSEIKSEAYGFNEDRLFREAGSVTDILFVVSNLEGRSDFSVAISANYDERVKIKINIVNELHKLQTNLVNNTKLIDNEMLRLKNKDPNKSLKISKNPLLDYFSYFFK